MIARAMAVLGVAAVALSAVGGPTRAAQVAADALPPEIAEAALTYANALAAGDLTESWGMLSAESRSSMTRAKWAEQFQAAAVARRPPAKSLVGAIAGVDPPPAPGQVLLRDGEALIEVSGPVQITQELVMLRERPGWRVDLAASDRLNARRAAQAFLDAVRAEAGAGSPGTAARRMQGTMSALRLLFAEDARDYRVLGADVEANRALVTVAAEVPVSLVLRAKRSGAGWVVDLSNPMLSVDATSPDPIGAAVAEADKMSCEEQLRGLGRALQMYMAASDDMFPDPDRWLDQIGPYLPAGLALHCPVDPAEGISYAMNRNLAGKRRREVGNQIGTPLLFESALHAPNAADTGESWIEPPRHPDGNLVLFVDGRVRPSARKPDFTVTKAEPGAGPPAGGRPLRPRPPPRPRPGPRVAPR